MMRDELDNKCQSFVYEAVIGSVIGGLFWFYVIQELLWTHQYDIIFFMSVVISALFIGRVVVGYQGYHATSLRRIRLYGWRMNVLIVAVFVANIIMLVTMLFLRPIDPLLLVFVLLVGLVMVVIYTVLARRIAKNVCEVVIE